MDAYWKNLRKTDIFRHPIQILGTCISPREHANGQCNPYVPRELWPTNSAAIGPEWRTWSTTVSFPVFCPPFTTHDQSEKIKHVPQTHHIIWPASSLPSSSFHSNLQPAYLKPSLFSLWSFPTPLPAYESLPKASDEGWLPRQQAE